MLELLTPEEHAFYAEALTSSRDLAPELLAHAMVITGSLCTSNPDASEISIRKIEHAVNANGALSAADKGAIKLRLYQAIESVREQDLKVNLPETLVSRVEIRDFTTRQGEH